MVPTRPHRGAPLGVSHILVKSLSHDQQPQTSYKVAHRNDGSFTFLYEFNMTRPAHCDYNHPHTSTNAHIYMKSQITHTQELSHTFQP
jgi:hypothetical protein